MVLPCPQLPRSCCAGSAGSWRSPARTCTSAPRCSTSPLPGPRSPASAACGCCTSAPSSGSDRPTCSRAPSTASLAGLVLIPLLPVMLGVAIAVKRDPPAPVIFRQDRVGRDGRHFTMLKFRTMHVDADETVQVGNESDGVLFKVRSTADHPSGQDPAPVLPRRAPPAGERHARPHVLRAATGAAVRGGEVRRGPPTPARGEARSHRPVAGLGRSDLSWSDTVRLDLLYVDNWSFSLDLVILCRTVKAVLGHRGAY